MSTITHPVYYPGWKPMQRGGIVRTIENTEDPKAGGGEKDYSKDETPFGDPDSQEGDAD